MSKPVGLHSLDENVAHLICSHLSAYDLSSLAATSTVCNALVSQDALWQPFTPSARGGCARRNYLRSVAWNSARATHSVCASQGTSVVNNVHLTPHGVLCASLSTSLTHISHNARASFFSAALDVAPHPVALCAAFSDHMHAPVSYLATAYSDASVKLVSICQRTRACSWRRVRPPLRNERISCVHTMCDDGQNAVLIVGTTHGNIVLTADNSHKKVPISPHAISALFSTDVTLIIGTDGGEVYTLDTTTQATTQLFIGACPCPITSVHRHGNVLIAGIRHVVAGNGHTCAAVAWNTRTHTRLPSLGRVSFGRSSSALPPMPTHKVRVSAERAALLVHGRVRVLQLRDWRCIVDAGFGSAAVDVAMDESRLAVGCDSGAHVLDFEQALLQWPHQLRSFTPCT